MEDNEMRNATETREDDNGGVIEMQENKYGRQVQSWRRSAHGCSGGDVGQWGQRQYRCRKTDTAVEETRDWRQKKCGTTKIAVLGEINCDGCRCIATYTPDWEEEGKYRINN